MSKMILAGALAALVVAAPPGAAADSGQGHSGKSASQGLQSEHAGAHQAEGRHPGEPTDLARAWAALVAARDAIARDVEVGALGGIHAKAELLPKLAETLLAQSQDLEPERRARVEGAVAQVPRVAEALHVAADGGDAARTRKALASLDGLIQLLRAQYPGGAPDAGGAPGHEAPSAAPGHAQSAHAHVERPAAVVEAEPRATLRVVATDPFRFEPTHLEVEAGVPTRIELANQGLAEHLLVVRSPDGERDWIHLHAAPGATEAATYRLDQPGTYPVACTIPGHAEGGMVGELVVWAPSKALPRVDSGH